MTDLLPCPFCGSEIKHVESWARSFIPPRLRHEWHHVADNKEICPVRRGIGKIVATATDDIEMQHVTCRWNNRAPGLAQAAPSHWARNAAIEECAKIAEQNYALMFTKQENRDVARKVSAQILKAICALTRPQPGGAVAGTERGGIE